VVFAGFGFNRCTQLLPVGEQFIQCSRLEHISREDVRANFSTLVDHTNADICTLLLSKLLQSDSSRKARRSRTDSYHIINHSLSRLRL
jgi:hypothetical protein